MHKYYPEPCHNNILAIFPDRIEIEDYWIKPKDFVLGETKFRRNPIITDLFIRIAFGEKMGSGIMRMNKICEKENAPKPEIKIRENYFYVTFRQSYEYLEFISRENVESRLVEGLVEGLVENQKKILTLVRTNPYVSKKEMSENIGISTTAIDKNISSLKKKGILKRIGPAKGGYWEVVK
ncbi:MAG: hypothetical protein A7315_12785 [Candidatus Altiarchaeales archaeon WOR_SM1_79]|nr:MAG: hypothetical protein A7315_12785 [Candidatus Altiarchaeales archaeon WOR_SM1_79]